jgi:hypothetical protein
MFEKAHGETGLIFSGYNKKTQPFLAGLCVRACDYMTRILGNKILIKLSVHDLGINY